MIRTETIPVYGMMCEHCVKAVKMALEDVDGVTESSDYLGIAWFDEGVGTWKWLGGEVDAGANTIRIHTIKDFNGTFVMYTRIFGDITGDGYVDVKDLQRFGHVWLHESSGEFPSDSDEAFFNYNKNASDNKQKIDISDFQEFGHNWLNGTP